MEDLWEAKAKFHKTEGGCVMNDDDEEVDDKSWLLSRLSRMPKRAINNWHSGKLATAAKYLPFLCFALQFVVNGKSR